MKPYHWLILIGVIGVGLMWWGIKGIKTRDIVFRYKDDEPSIGEC